MDTLRGHPRMDIFVMNQTGLGDGSSFSFWAMVIGGFFLYFSYYGCDQSQAQRLLTTATPKEAQKALLYNGIFRFFLVITYLILGVFLIAFIEYHPDFAASLKNQKSDFLVPMFLVRYFPSGLLGIMVAGFFAATMSSLDSALNSLSAATYKDVLEKMFPEKMKTLSPEQEVFVSRILTVLWGSVATIFALFLMSGQETVIELVNKIGSAFYGPVLGIFLLAIFVRERHAIPAIVALITGVTTNIILWQFFPDQISWMWWNGIGFIVTILSYFVFLFIFRSPNLWVLDRSLFILWKKQKIPFRFLFMLSIAFIVFLVVGWWIEITF
jgi:SSS family solute:Na+ symporter